MNSYLEFDLKNLTDRQLMEFLFVNQMNITEKLNRVCEYLADKDVSNSIFSTRVNPIDTLEDLVGYGIETKKALDSFVLEVKNSQ